MTIFYISADHVAPKYAADSVQCDVRPAPGRPGYFYASAPSYGCGKDAPSEFDAVRVLFRDHACTNIRTVAGAVVWTGALASAVGDIAFDDTQSADARSRAGEITNARAGHILAPHQVEFVTCLRQRLADGANRDAFESAWADAWRGAQGDIAR